MKTHEEPIIVEQTFSIAVQKVWQAITEIGQMRQWYFDNITDFKPEIGFETRFTVQNEDRVFPHVWKVTEVIPEKLIKYSWRYEGYRGDSVLAMELSKEDDLIRLRLTHTVTEDFEERIPEFTRESGLQGWTYFIKESLVKYLNINR
jgi:uncharacterized protein YndB with AHSA1/START domain